MPGRNLYVGDPDVYEVEDILDSRIVKKKSRIPNTQYLVKWKGYSEKHNSWVSATNISKDLIKEFNENNAKSLEEGPDTTYTEAGSDTTYTEAGSDSAIIQAGAISSVTQAEVNSSVNQSGLENSVIQAEANCSLSEDEEALANLQTNINYVFERYNYK